MRITGRAVAALAARRGRGQRHRRLQLHVPVLEKHLGGLEHVIASVPVVPNVRAANALLTQKVPEEAAGPVLGVDRRLAAAAAEGGPGQRPTWAPFAASLGQRAGQRLAAPLHIVV